MQINEQYYTKLEKIVSSKITKVSLFVFVILFIGLSLYLKQPDFLFFGFLPLVIYVSLKKSIARKNFMMQYAKTNNLSFEFSKTVNFPGRLFKLGGKNNTCNILNLIYGTYNKYPIKIFHYEYSIGSGKNKHTYYFTVCEVEITDLDFPFILLKSNLMMKHAETDYFGYDKDTEIKLEGEFKDKFKLYCRDDYEIEVLQIFDTNLLSYLTEHGTEFSIEFAKNKIYIYEDKIITDQKEMDEIYIILKNIIDRSGALLKRLRDDFEAMHQFYNKG